MKKSAFTAKYARFVDLLVAARNRAGLNQRQLAALIRKPRSFVGRYETRERRIDLIEFIELAEVLDLDPLDFLRQLLAEFPAKRKSKKKIDMRP